MSDIVGLEDPLEDSPVNIPVLASDATDPQIEQYFQSGRPRVVQERNDFFFPHVVDFIEGRKWGNLKPEYQRRLRWDLVKKSQLIESFIMNVPVPPVFLFEKSIGSFEVMDGQQRLSTIVDFYRGRFELKGLKVWEPLNGRTFENLPPLVRRGLERAKISAITLSSDQEDGGSGLALRSQVFERLNTGGEKLNQQELRNALYGGDFNRMLIDLSGLPEFTSAWEIPSHQDHILSDGAPDEVLKENNLYRRMIDVEIVLRYFAFRDSSQISGSVRKMLDDTAKNGMSLQTDEVLALKREFTETLKTAKTIFGEELFRLAPTKEGAMGSLSRPLYDAVMVALHELNASWEALIAKAGSIKETVIGLTRPTADSYELMVGRGNTAALIKERIELVKSAMQAGA